MNNSVRAIRQHFEMFQQTFSNALNDSSPYAAQPPHIIPPLRIHQLAALEDMRKKEISFQRGYSIPNTNEVLFSKYAFLGDRAGVGKTLMALGHISQQATYPLTPESQNPLSNLNPESTPACFSILSKSTPTNLYDSLIVVPHTLYKQWQDTISTQTSLKAHFVKSHRDLDKDTFYTNMSSSHVTLVSNNLLSYFMNSLQTRSPVWRRVFYDEADTIKIISSCTRPDAYMTWYITASYTNLLLVNHHYHSYILRQLPETFVSSLSGELQTSIKHSVDNHPNVTFFRTTSYPFFISHLKSQHPLRGYLVIRSTEEFLNESVQLPPLHQQIIRCQTPFALSTTGLWPPLAEAMIHAGDISGALQSIGISQHTNITIIDAVTEFRTKELNILKNELENANPHEQTILTQKITTLEAQIQGIKQRLEQASKEVCAICYDPPKSCVMTPCCSKPFCGSCILKWMLRTPVCPLCRTAIHPNELKSIGEKDTPRQQMPKKIDALLKILQENPDGRFLVFSHFDITSIQETITNYFPSQMIQGNKDMVAKQVADFDSGNVKILLLNSRMAAAGLNLPSATHVILLHRMAIDEEKQIIGRAYRLGRTKPLHLIKLFHQKE